MPFLRGQTQVSQAKGNWGSPFSQKMKPAYAFLPLTHWCWLTEPTETGRVVGFFLYLKGMYKSLPFCLGFAFTVGRMGPRAVLLPRHNLLHTWGSYMSRKMAGDKHLPFCPPAPRYPSWVSDPQWMFSCPEEEIEAFTGASNFIFWGRSSGPQYGDSRAVLGMLVLFTGYPFYIYISGGLPWINSRSKWQLILRRQYKKLVHVPCTM